ncbi:type IV pilus modification protein PilV [Reinekea sp. G2M2-21]|uniref:type IV pilus modification protein PilV n=1 Tax=Reinekea sp. G2M2-21 TaxID=2788942 RepID=UPI0018ABD348|nr:type IV pilus modification protein PilV [Reinekea sp. G2M2-21]
MSFFKQTGAGLLEVLIAVIVLAVGLLGFAALQTQALRMNYETLQQARASSLAEDILDRMRSNQVHAIETEDYERDFGDALPVVATDCAAATCTPAEMAAWDMNQWITARLQAQNATADARIIQDPNNLGTDDARRFYQIDIRMVEVSQQRAQGAAAFNADNAEDQLITVSYQTYL